MSRRDGSATVYSSQHGRMCPECSAPMMRCRCRVARGRAAAASDGVARVRREVKGRRGKTVTTISGLSLADDALRALAAELKRSCGSGGSVKDGTIEIQGDHRDALLEELDRRGIRAKRAGG